MSNDNLYTLANLVTRLGASTEADARALLEGMSDAELVRKGAEIGTPRLVKELARNYGTFADWLPNATPQQLDLLGFVDGEWLRVAVWCGRQAQTLNEQRTAGKGGGAGGKQVLEATASELETKGRAAVSRLCSTLKQLSGGLVGWTAKIDVAASTVIGASPTADALEALCDLADTMLKDTTPGMVARKARCKLTTASLADLRAQASELRKAVEAANAVRNAAEVQQSDVDLWDGFAVTLFEQFVEATEAARETDPRIPAPSIIGLKSWFRRGSRKKKDGEGEQGPPEEDNGATGTN